ncbi:MAG: hypothetical protein DMG59_05445 [Acidobacteria bacterium]|nr:MAG: hypothetical protein DMG59_05445 [Acidobacteriota bacterium]
MQQGILFLALASFAWGQAPANGGIRGQVLDPSGAAIIGVEVDLSNADTGLRRHTVSGESGYYAIPELPLTGRYRIRFSKPGFAVQERSELRLRSGESATANAVLSPEEQREKLIVHGTADGLQTDSAQLAGRMDRERIEETPVPGGKLTALPLLDSAVRTAKGTGDLFLNNFLYVIDGGGRRQTSYVIDGGTADDAWGRQTIFTNMPLAAIEELTVYTNSLSAAYGRTSSGVVNVNTRAGTNSFHGDFSGLWRPAGIEARNPVAARRTADILEQGDGLLSGPVTQNKTFFMISGEQTRGHRDSTITSILMPQQNYRGSYDDSLLLGRLDHNFSNRNSAALRVNMDRMTDTNPQDAVGGLNLPSTARVFRRNAYAAQVSETAVLSPVILNEARVVFEVGSPITEFTPVAPSIQFTQPGVGTVGESRSGKLQNHQYQLAEVFSYARGAHNWKFGGDVFYSTSGGFGQEFGSGFVLGQFTVRDITKQVSQMTIADATRFSQSFGNPSYRVGEWLASVFAEDAWRMRRDFTLTLGLRFERNTFSDAAKDFSPRFGFSWQPFGDQKTVVRGSYGIFYSQLRANLQASFALNGPAGVFNMTASPGQLGFPASLAPLAALQPGDVVPPRDITIRPGDAAYYSRFFDVSKLRYYSSALVDPWTQHVSLGVQRELSKGWILSVDGVHQITSRIDRPIDLNAPQPFVRTAAGQTRSGAAADATRPITPANGGYRRIIAVVNDGLSRYDGLQVDLKRRLGRAFSLNASYTYSHTINTVEPDGTQQDPNDANFLGRTERANSLLDQRHRAVLSGWWRLPAGVVLGTVTSLASARPYNITTGVDNNADNSTADRPVVNGGLFGRNSGRGTPTYDVGTFVEREFRLPGERVRLELRAEAFNLLNHANIVGRNGTWGNADAPVSTLGAPLGGISNVEPGRQFQFLLRASF